MKIFANSLLIASVLFLTCLGLSSIYTLITNEGALWHGAIMLLFLLFSVSGCVNILQYFYQGFQRRGSGESFQSGRPSFSEETSNS